MAVVDEDVGRPGSDGARDRRVRLADHQVGRGRVLGVRPPRGPGVADPGDPFHVDAEIDPHAPQRSGYQTSPGRHSQEIGPVSSTAGVDGVSSTMTKPSSSGVGRSPPGTRTNVGPGQTRQPSRP